MDITRPALISSGSSSSDDDTNASIVHAYNRTTTYPIDELHIFSSKQSSSETSSSWKDACLKHKHMYDYLSLPSLDEAAILFGFSK